MRPCGFRIFRLKVPIPNLIIVDIILVDLLGDDEESNEILLFYHYLHLIENKLELLSLVHRTIGLNLNFLKNICSLQDIVIILLVLNNHQYASSIFNLHYPTLTSKKIFFAQTSRIV